MPRRGENIYKRKDGRWEGRVMLTGGKKGRYRSFYSDTYLGVRKKMKAFDPESLNQSDESPKITLEYFAMLWLDSVKIRCKLSTYNKYRAVWNNHIYPAFGRFSVGEISSEAVGQLILSKNALSAQTRRDILCVLKMILERARSEGFDTAEISHLNVRQESRNMRVLTLDEQALLSAYLTEGQDLCRIGTYLSLCTGVRIGELCALKRKNISFETNTLSITGTMQRIQVDGEVTKTRIIITEPKSRKSVREIPLPDFIAARFKKYYGGLENEAYLLSGRADKFVEPRVLEYKFKKYIAECGLNDVHFHTLRHTFATRCIENNFEIKALSEIMGHETVNITLNRYIHSSEDFKRSNMEKLKNLF